MYRIFFLCVFFNLLSEIGFSQFGNENILVDTLTYGEEVTTIDIDDDGDEDIIVLSNQGNSVSWFENLGSGNFGTQQILLAGVSALECSWPTDLDLDGDIDLLVAGGNPGSIYWFENVSGALTSAQIIYAHTEMLNQATVADLDGDGDDDIVASFPFSNEVVCFENLGGANFGSYQVMNNITDLPGSIDAGDLDNDGDLDIVFANYTQDIVEWQENLGGFLFGPPDTLDGLLDFCVDADIGDLNNDGFLDIVSLGKYSNQVGWFKNNGNGTFGSLQLFDISISWPTNLDLRDVDNDSDLDIICAGSNTPHTIQWIENINGSTFYQGVLIANYYSAHHVHTSDLDNDGDFDIVAASFHGHKASWFENKFLSNYQARGKAFIDFNENGQIDSNDVGASMIQVYSNPQNSFGYTYADGKYFMNFDTSLYMTYQIIPNNLQYWGITTDSLSYQVVVDSSFTLIDSLDFGFFPDTLVDSIKVDLNNGFPRCNTVVNYWLDVHNIGTTTPDGIIELVLDDSVSFIDASIVPDSAIGQVVYWHFDSLFYFSNYQINIHVQMPSFMNIGDTLESQATVYIDSLNGTSYEYQLTHGLNCAYDPNDKQSLPEGVDSLGYIPVGTPYLDYRIRFQNTGNDTAFTVVILDRIDSSLNWNSFAPLSSSHDMIIDFDPSIGEVSFIFNDIMLPDSNVNELESHGFVKYRVYLNSALNAGTTINNTAEIYFDYNPAIVTNTTVNTLYDCNSLLMTASVQSAGCLEDTIIGGFLFSPPEVNYAWVINGDTVSSNQSLLWEANVSGLLSLEIHVDNQFCQNDSSLSIEIYPTFIDSTFIEFCEGDSVYVLGDYQVVSSILIDSLLTQTGCDSTHIYKLNMTPLPNIFIDPLSSDTLCENWAIENLNAIPPGGQFSGIGVNGNSFDPVSAGLGLHYIYYQVDNSGCPDLDSIAVVVNGCPEIESHIESIWLVYPNPVDNQLIVNCSQSDPNYYLQIVDMQGRIILTKSNSGEYVVVNTSNWSMGVYFLNIISFEDELIDQIKLIRL